MRHAAKKLCDIKAPLQPSKLRVAGSNPAGVANNIKYLVACITAHIFPEISAWEEYFLHTLLVGGLSGEPAQVHLSC